MYLGAMNSKKKMKEKAEVHVLFAGKGAIPDEKEKKKGVVGCMCLSYISKNAENLFDDTQTPLVGQQAT